MRAVSTGMPNARMRPKAASRSLRAIRNRYAGKIFPAKPSTVQPAGVPRIRLRPGRAPWCGVGFAGRPCCAALRWRLSDPVVAVRFTVATYNIHKGFSQLNRRMVIHELKDKLHGLAVDVLFLQEVLGANDRHAIKY